MLFRSKDVARVELGARDYEFVGRVNNVSATLIGIFLQPGANALDVGESVRQTLAGLRESFPPGLAYEITYDTTAFVRVSIHEVVKTLAEAMVLVFLVVFLFLQSWRATLIPSLAVPVSLIGTFGAMYLFGFSVNNLTLMAMTIATGFVVDDAIVMIENIARYVEQIGRAHV